jgi:hypothetical protein
VRQYATPHFYKNGASWQAIDSSLTPDTGKPGWWHSGANTWSASFGPSDTASGNEQVAVGDHVIGFAPLDATGTNPRPTVTGQTATYHSLWSNVDVKDTVTPNGVDEDIVLAGPDSPSNFKFRLSGATSRENTSGGLDLSDGGTTVGQVPAPTVETAQLNDPEATRASGAELTASGDIVTVTISPSWLTALPVSAFPVVIDPDYVPPNQHPTAAYAEDNAGDSDFGSITLGRDAAGHQWRGEYYFPSPTLPAAPSGKEPYQLYQAEFTFTSTTNANSAADWEDSVRGFAQPQNMPPP